MPHLIVKVMVLLQLLNISFAAGAEKCFNEGETVTYECRVPAAAGILDWNGSGFDCLSSNTITSNVLSLPTATCPLPHEPVYIGVCGPYFGNLTCTEDQQHLISVLEFEANYGMNGGYIKCLFNTNGIETFPIRVGVTPNPPSNVRVITRQDRCQFEWISPNEIVGGIGGYIINYGENCGNCTPEAGFHNQTKMLTADCSECQIEENSVCHFEVSAVSEDCLFGSLSVEATSDSPINSPMDSAVAITCSLTPNPPIYVEWTYTFSEESRRAFLGFLITISDQFGHNVEDILLDSKVRSKYVNSTVLKESDNFVGDIWNVTVEVAFGEDRNKFTYDSIQFSVEDTIMIDISSASQCIDVSINNHCDERSDTFQAQVQFNKGTCESNGELIITTSNYTLQEDYKTCIPVVADTICYSTVIFHNELELGKTERQELVLMQCTLETSNSAGWKINSTIGDIPLGVEVMIPHNTTLYFSCDLNCTLNNDHTLTRCVNGTFQPAVTYILHNCCSVSSDSQIFIGYITGSVAVIIVMLVGCPWCILIVMRKKRKRPQMEDKIICCINN